jgi:hypothetical protein
VRAARRSKERRAAKQAPELLRAVGDENEINGGWASGDRQKAATPMLAALAREEIAIKRVIVLAEEHALAPAPRSRDMIGKAGDDEPGDAGHLDPWAICCEDRGFNWGLSKPLP